MKIITLYIARHVIAAILLVLLLFFGLNLFMQLVAEIGDLGKGNYGIVQALLYVMLQMPQLLYQYFPMAGLVGALAGLGSMASNNELIVMQAAGVSIREITIRMLHSVAILVVVMVLCGEVVGPNLSNYADKLKQSWVRRSQVSMPSNTWLQNNGNFIYFKKQTSPNSLQGVSVFRFDNKHMLISYGYAPTATSQNLTRWELHNVSQTTINAHNVAVSSQLSKSANFRIDPNAFVMSDSFFSYFSLLQLHNLVKYYNSVGLSSASFSYQFWQRVFSPLVSILMICIAVPFVFGSLRNASMSLRLVIGLSLGFSFFVLTQIIGTVGLVMLVPPFVSALLPLVVFLAVYLFLIYRL